MKHFTVGLALLLCFSALSAVATPVNKLLFNNKYGTAGSNLDDCITCHTTSNPTPPVEWNSYGLALANQGSGTAIDTRLSNIEGDDSDGDLTINVTEITIDGTFPGDASSVPVAKNTWGEIKSLFR